MTRALEAMLLAAVLTASEAAQTALHKGELLKCRIEDEFLRKADLWVLRPAVSEQSVTLDDLRRLVDRLDLERQKTNDVERLSNVCTRTIAAIGTKGERADYGISSCATRPSRLSPLCVIDCSSR